MQETSAKEWLRRFQEVLQHLLVIVSFVIGSAQVLSMMARGISAESDKCYQTMVKTMKTLVLRVSLTNFALVCVAAISFQLSVECPYYVL